MSHYNQKFGYGRGRGGGGFRGGRGGYQGSSHSNRGHQDNNQFKVNNKERTMGYLIYELQNATSLPISPPDSAKAELYDRAFESTKRAVVAPPMTNESRAVIDILESCGFTVPDSVALSTGAAISSMPKDMKRKISGDDEEAKKKKAKKEEEAAQQEEKRKLATQKRKETTERRRKEKEAREKEDREEKENMRRKIETLEKQLNDKQPAPVPHGKNLMHLELAPLDLNNNATGEGKKKKKNKKHKKAKSDEKASSSKSAEQASIPKSVDSSETPTTSKQVEDRPVSSEQAPPSVQARICEGLKSVTDPTVLALLRKIDPSFVPSPSYLGNSPQPEELPNPPVVNTSTPSKAPAERGQLIMDETSEQTETTTVTEVQEHGDNLWSSSLYNKEILEYINNIPKQK